MSFVIQPCNQDLFLSHSLLKLLHLKVGEISLVTLFPILRTDNVLHIQLHRPLVISYTPRVSFEYVLTLKRAWSRQTLSRILMKIAEQK